MRTRITQMGPLAMTLATLLAVVLVSGTVVQAQDVPKKLERQMRIVEALVSDVLIDSPYWLVSSGGHVNSFYQKDLGVVVTLEASLVGGDSNIYLGDHFALGDIRVERHGGRVVVFSDDDDDWYWEDDDDEDEDIDEDDDELSKKWRSRRMQRSESRYEKGKEELREALIDYGESLAGLKDDETVMFVTYLNDHRYFRKNKISRLMLKAKVKDLRARADGDISFDEMNSRIVEEVY